MSLPLAGAPSPETLLVTGATGFLGRALVARLLAARPAPRLRALVRPAAESRLPPGVEAVAGDLEDPASLARAVAGARAVVHAAAALAAADPARLARVNVEGTRALAAAARAAGVRRFVLVSSSAVYGFGPADASPATEASAPRPAGAYAASKEAAERAAREALGEESELVVVRPTGLYGPGRELWTKRLDALVRLPLRVELPGDERVQPCHVGDAVRALLGCLAAPPPAPRCLNLAGRDELAVGELDARLAALAGVRLRRARLPAPLARPLVALRLALAPVAPETARRLRLRARGVTLAARVDASLAERRLGLVWTPLEIGLREMVDLWRRARDRSGAW